MKLWLICLCLLFWCELVRAQDWPRNPQTGQIEFAGTLAWPAAARTAEQRRALVRRWYATKVSDQLLASPGRPRRSVPGPLTYAQLPQEARLRYHPAGRLSQLNYCVQLTASPRGLTYRFSNFLFGWPDDDVVQQVSLEKALPLTQIDPAALPALRRRLDEALASW